MVLGKVRQLSRGQQVMVVVPLTSKGTVLNQAGHLERAQVLSQGISLPKILLPPLT